MLEQRNRSLILTGAIVGLLAVTIFGALSQSGVLVPRFRLSGTGGGESSTGTVFSNNLQNVSPRSWTITGIHLADENSARMLPDVHIIRLGLQTQSSEPWTNFPGPMLRRLTVAPGQYFDVNLVERQSDCRSQSGIRSVAQEQGLANSAENHQHNIPVVLTVGTPLGARTVGTTVTIDCGL